jgi:hypothetical protein
VYEPVQFDSENRPLAGRWTKAALQALADRSPGWRRQWADMHRAEIEIVRAANAAYAERIDAVIDGTAEQPVADAEEVGQ